MPQVIEPHGAKVAKATRPEPVQAFPRTRLYDLLDAAAGKPITWIEGPAGAGKTTLVTSYLKARKLNCLWNQIDASDADIPTFFHYLSLAATRSAPRSRKPLPVLTPEYLPGLVAFSHHYFESLWQRLRPPAILVLDNYQELPEDSPLHALLAQELSLLPEGVRFIVMSRTAPPPAWARLRAYGHLNVIGPESLRLTFEELVGIAALRKGPEALSAEDAQNLLAYTQGWMAGVVLTLEQAGTFSLSAVPQLTEATRQMLFDFFAYELLRKLDPATQAVLLKSSLLPKMTARMVSQLTGDEDAERILEDLVRTNYFIVRHRQTAFVYEFHPLFRTFLLARATEAFDVAEITALRNRAAAILDADGQREVAAALYLETGNAEGLSRLILKEAAGLIAQGRHQTLGQWLGRLPPPVVEAMPWLSYWQGMALVPFNPDAARACFEQAFTGFDVADDARGLYLAWAALIQTVFFEFRALQYLDRWVPVLDQLKTRHPVFPSIEIEARVTSMAVSIGHRLPQQSTKPWAERCHALVREIADVNQRLFLGAGLVLYDAWAGDLVRAGHVAEILKAQAGDEKVSPMAYIYQSVCVALYHNFRGEARAALVSLEGAVQVIQKTGLHVLDFLVNIQRVIGHLGAGDFASAGAILQDLLSATKSQSPFEVVMYHHLRSTWARQYGHQTEALQHARTALAMSSSAGSPLLEALCSAGLALLGFESGEKVEAETYLRAAHAIGVSLENRLIQSVCLAIEAKIAVQREEERGLVLLRELLILGKDSGGLSPVALWGPAHAACLFIKALEAGIEVDYVRQLIRRSACVPEEPPVHVENWPWPIKIYTLGRFAIVREDEPLQFTGKTQARPLELLKALIATGGRSVPDERLAGMLWPDADGDAALQAFATTLHRLRRLLKDERVLISEDRCLSLDARRVWLDIWAFQRLLGEKGVDEISEITRTGQALQLYRGPFLKELSVPWVLLPREQFRVRYVRRVEIVGMRLEKGGVFEAAIDGYLKGLEVDPYAEGFYIGLMRCYQNLGRPADAVRVYQRCYHALGQLSLTPSATTQALYHRLIG